MLFTEAIYGQQQLERVLTMVCCTKGYATSEGGIQLREGDVVRYMQGFLQFLMSEGIRLDCEIRGGENIPDQNCGAFSMIYTIPNTSIGGTGMLRVQIR